MLMLRVNPLHPALQGCIFVIAYKIGISITITMSITNAYSAGAYF